MGSDREEIESACDTAIGLPGHTEHQALHAMPVILERPLNVWTSEMIAVEVTLSKDEIRNDIERSKAPAPGALREGASTVSARRQSLATTTNG